MTHNERHHIAARLVRKLKTRGVLRSALEIDVEELIADELDKACTDYATGDPHRRAAYLAEAVLIMKRAVREIIPTSFGWWLEFDHDVRASVRWVWLGHPAVTHCGSISDSDFSLALDFLRSVDWDAEIRRAMANIEETETQLLKHAQARRRLMLSGSAHLIAKLPPIQLPEPAPATFEDKRLAAGPLEIPASRLTTEQAAERIREAKKATEREELDALHRHRKFSGEAEEHLDDLDADDYCEEDDGPEPEPPQPLVIATVPPPIPTGLRRPRYPSEEGKPQLVFGLSRERSRVPLAFVKFEPFDTLADLIRAVKAAPPDTYSYAWLHAGEDSIYGAPAIWDAFGVPTNPERPPKASQRRP